MIVMKLWIVNAKLDGIIFQNKNDILYDVSFIHNKNNSSSWLVFLFLNFRLWKTNIISINSCHIKVFFIHDIRKQLQCESLIATCIRYNIRHCWFCRSSRKCEGTLVDTGTVPSTRSSLYPEVIVFPGIQVRDINLTEGGVRSVNHDHLRILGSSVIGQLERIKS